MSLRLRLTIGLAVVVIAGLAVAGWTTYAVVRAFLVDRVDEQLVAARTPAVFELRASQGEQRPPPQGGHGGDGPKPFGPGIPAGTYVEERDASGTVIASATFSFGDETYGTPALPAGLLAGTSTTQPTFFTTGSADGEGRYRVLAQGNESGGALLIALPLDDLDSTLSGLRNTILVVSALVTLAVVAGAASLVHFGLRPLARMSETASAIAEGNLDLRVAETSPRTETGRLGRSLNSMLERLQQAFAARQASEAKLRRFVADASHELRTPLTSIRGYTELFGRGAKDRPEDLERVMARIDEQSGRMQLMVEDLLLLARLDQERELVLEPCDLAAIAAEAGADARVLQPARPISVHAGAPVLVRGDRARLHQVAMNLVTNALTHTPEEAAITIAVHREGESAVLTVRDEGPGLTEEQAAQVFEPFYRADRGRARAMGGTGLGLAIVAGIVEAHGGSVGVTSTPGRGAVFTVRLPVEGTVKPGAS